MAFGSTLVAQNERTTLSFDGAGDYVELGDVLNEVSVPFTVEFWAKVDNVVDHVYPIRSDDSGSGPLHHAGFWMTVGGGNEVTIHIGNNSGGGIGHRRAKRSVTSDLTDRWHHYSGVVRSANDMSLYIDGVDIGGVYEGGAQFMTHNSDPARIGSSTLNRFFYGGELDEMRVWNRAKSTSEILTDMFREINPVLSDALVGYWKFHEGSGQILNDRGPNSYDGSLGGDISTSSNDPDWVFSGAPIGFNSCIGNRSDVVGIWRVQNSASSYGLEIQNIDMIQDLGDWVVFGNNSRFTPGYTFGDTELPALARWNRHWCVDFSDEELTEGGILSLSFDFSEAGFSTTLPEASNVRLLRTNPNSGVFEIVKDATGAPLFPSVSGDEFSFDMDPSSAQGLLDQFETLDGVYTLGVIEVPLPVELNNLKAITVDEGVVLSWETLSEQNNAGFEIELFRDSEYAKVGWIDGKGNSSESTNYSFVYGTNSPGDYKFRLKQIDYSGAYVYARPIEVYIGVPSKLYVESAYPNPASNGWSVITVVKNDDEQINVEMFDVGGKRTDSANVVLTSSGSRSEVTVDTGDLVSGIYVVRVQSGNQVVTKKLIVLN